jgi:nicotinamide-nucleotide amidase
MNSLDPNYLTTIANVLRRRSWQLAVAESLTAGHVQVLIASFSGASDFFVGGITAYQTDRKIELLGVDRHVAESSHGVSADVAEQMARGAIELFRADCAIATTGYAEPAIDRNVPSPFAFCSVARLEQDHWKYRTVRVDASGNRNQVQQFIANQAVELLYLDLSSL